MPATRQHLHTRSVEYRGYKRSDGFWDIEAEMRDIRHYETFSPQKGTMPPGAPIHHIALTLTVDDHLSVQSISAQMRDTPFPICLEVETKLQVMIGANLSRGWRRSIDDRLGGTRNCTHLRELLFNMATVAFQTIPIHRSQMERAQGNPPSSTTEPPYFLGKCHAWRFDGPVVAWLYPQFHAPSPRDSQDD